MFTFLLWVAFLGENGVSNDVSDEKFIG